MKVSITKLTGIDVAQACCEATMHGAESNITVAKLARCEHSPLRALMYLVEMTDIPTFVSVHLVRHKHGVEHFVKSMRSDNPAVQAVADRNTPVNHTMLINAQALINMARKRLCNKAHLDTFRLMLEIRMKLREVEPELVDYLVPDCVYRGGVCWELKGCGCSQDYMQVYGCITQQ